MFKKPKMDDFPPQYLVHPVAIGRGSYGNVYKAKDKMDGNRLLAMKKIRLMRIDGYLDDEPVEEARILQQLANPHVVEYIDHWIFGDNLFIMTELLETDLSRCLAMRTTGFSPDTARAAMHGILTGLAYIHERGYVHLDLKPSNILLNYGGEIKIADFGLAQSIKKGFTSYNHTVMTYPYRAPEVFFRWCRIVASADIWSVGLIMFEMINKHRFFAGIFSRIVLYEMVNLFGTQFPDEWNVRARLKKYQTIPGLPSLSYVNLFPEFMDNFMAVNFLSKMIQLKPWHRYRAKGLLKHPYFFMPLLDSAFLPCVMSGHEHSFECALREKKKTPPYECPGSDDPTHYHTPKCLFYFCGWN